jgi:NhaP-type Na+/H+ and K+/H+ antiporter
VSINSSEEKKEVVQQIPNSRIKINSDDLLYAVSHNKEDVKTYYAKYNLKKEDILRTIKSELKKSNIKINPETILAEVERTIDDDDFQNNFMKSLKNKISDIATVIASRND